MLSLRKDAKIVVIILVAGLLLAQGIRIEKTNPPVRADISADAAIEPVLRRACYNCHSHETVWPWYSNLAPASWLVGSDVKEARRRLNFSEWGTYDAELQSRKLGAIAEEMEHNEMPPWYYSLVHSDARLSQNQREQIRDWANSKLREVLKP
jgi:hypothetical protein